LIAQNFFFQVILPFSPTVFSLSSLYLSIYAYFFKIESKVTNNNIITILCFLGSLFGLLCALSSLLIGYFSISNSANSLYEANKSEFLKIETFIPDQRNMYSKDDAQLYFRKNGVCVEYTDKSETNVVYSPDQIDNVHYNIIQTYYQIKELAKAAKHTVFLIILITFFSFFLFIVFLIYKLRSR
jgi:ATP-dependent Zn protease